MQRRTARLYAHQPLQMISKLIASVTPYLVWIALVIGLTFGGTLAWWFQGNRLERRDLRIERLEQDISIAERTAQVKAAQSEADFAILATRAAAAEQKEVIQYVEVIKEVDAVASDSNQCLSADTIGVLQRAKDSRNTQGSNPRVVPRPGPGPTTPAVRSTGGGASEKAIANYLAKVEQQYIALQRRDRDKAQTIRNLPCVQVVPG